MKPPFSSSRWSSIAATLLIPLAIGCASPGPPQPPSLHLPQIVNDLTAERLGDTVALRWTTPSRTTDDIDIKGPITAEICREIRPALSRQTPHPRGCFVVKRMPVRSGLTEAADALPTTLTGDPMDLLLYRVRLFNSNGRTAGPSPAAYSVSGAAPPAVDQLRATSTRSGVMLEWKPEPATFPVDLDRTLIIASAPKTATPSAVASKSAKPSKPALNLTPPTPAEVHLQAGNPSSDTGGTIDRTTMKGATYRYTAQRVRAVVLAGHTLELRSLPSPAVTVVTRDIFPPAAPTGLAAIPGSGSGNRSIDLSIDLSWEPVSDTDIAGYIVYRQTVTSDGAATAASKRLNQTPLTGPAFSDRTAVPGQIYLYRVTAIDASGNESAPSAAVQETLTEP